MGIVEHAIEVATLAHRHQVRKGTDLPYITHPFAVAMMVARAGCDTEMVAAALLHDTVEDTGLTLGELREMFGERVAAIVEGCSEPHKGAPWEERKTHTLEYLRTAPWEVRTVSCADKLHNLRTIAEEHVRSGEGVWQRFKRGRAEQEWYYRGLLASLCDTVPEGQEPVPFCAEFRRVVREVFGRT